MKKDDLLQDGLDRLESGESLDTSQQELPEEERSLLRLASRLRSAKWPERAPKIVNAQRDRLVEIYSKEMNMEPVRASRLQFFKDWRVVIGLSAGLAFLMVCGLFLALGAGAMIWANDRQASTDESPLIANFEVRDLKQVEKAVRNLASNEALLVELRGVVQIRQGEAWVAAKHGVAVAVDSYVRTGPLSSVKLAFKDGSFVRLGPNSELSIAMLDIDRKGGLRQVELMQWSGESDHMVARAQAEGSRYEVKTPTGSGTAKGTQFQVRVSTGLSSWYVSEGAVEVSGSDAAVLVEAGKMTSVAADDAPEEPVFFIAGEGEVSDTEPWVIAGQTYLTDTQTVIVGEPQVGDIVFFQGHLLDNGQRVAELIVLIFRNPTNTFSLVGKVDKVPANADDRIWIVNGQEISTTQDTEIISDTAIVVSDTVKVEGIILTTGALRANKIQKLEEAPGIPFDIIGVLEQIAPKYYVVSGITITVNTIDTSSITTTIQAGLVISDLVRVQGWILADGTWLAESISTAVDESRAFEFVGEVEGITPTLIAKIAIWKVAGISFETRPWTDIDDGLTVGDLVTVKGHILEDGTWVAFEIRRFPQEMVTFLIGRVFSMPPNPWVVGGVELKNVTEAVIDPTIKVGMLVRVKIHLLPDGTQKVVSIEPLEGFTWAQGCQEFIVTVQGIDDDEIQVGGWPNLPLAHDVEINGEVKPGSMVLIVICFNEDNSVKVTYIFILGSRIIPTEEPPTEEPPTVEPPTTVEPGRQEKVQVCHKPGSPAEKTLQVAAPAIPAHLGHGDSLGVCGKSIAPNP